MWFWTALGNGVEGRCDAIGSITPFDAKELFQSTSAIDTESRLCSNAQSIRKALKQVRRRCLAAVCGQAGENACPWALNSDGKSIFGKCAVPRITILRAPEMLSAIKSAAREMYSSSRSPMTISTGSPPADARIEGVRQKRLESDDQLTIALRATIRM